MPYHAIQMPDGFVKNGVSYLFLDSLSLNYNHERPVKTVVNADASVYTYVPLISYV